MKHTNANELARRLIGVCMILSPALVLTSELLRFQGGVEGARFGYWSGLAGLLAAACGVPAVLGFARLLWEASPRLAVFAGAVLSAVWTVGSSIMTRRMIFWTMNAAAPSHGDAAALQAAIDRQLFKTLVAPGIVYPLTLLVVGIGLLRTKAAPAWVAAVIILGAATFPAGRILLGPPLIHVTDVLLLVGYGWVGCQFLTRPRYWETPAHAPEGDDTSHDARPVENLRPTL